MPHWPNRAAVGFLLALSTSPASSQDTGVYLGASIGQAEYRHSCEGVTISCEQRTGSEWRLLGGYQFNRYVAVEIGYGDLGGPRTRTSAGGSADLATVTDVTASDLSALGSFPLFNRLFVYGRAGIYRAKVEFNSADLTGGFNGTGNIHKTSTGIVLGLGLKYEFRRGLAVRGEWQRYFDVEVGEGRDLDADFLSVALLYRF